MIDPRENNGGFGSGMLMDKSTAHPGNIDMSIFQPKPKPTGQGTVSSDYLQKTRADNPDNDDSANKKSTVSLTGCKFTTPPDDLEIEQEFQAEVKAQWTGTVSPEWLRVMFAVKMTWDDDGSPQAGEGMEKLTGFMKGDQSDQTVSVKGKLPRPPSFPPAGTKISYKLVASHPEARDTSESDAVELTLQETLHYVEVPDILFAQGGHFPCLDDQCALLDALTRSIKWSKENPDEQLVVFGHADTSGDHPINFDISDRRAQAAIALLTHDDKIWESLAKNHHKIEEIQRCLKTLSACHGWACDPGKVDDQDGPTTQGAVKKFQEKCNQNYKLGLTVDGAAGPKTWKAMHRVICGLVAKGLDVTDPESATYPDWDLPEIAYSEGSGAYGCGESFPVDKAEVDGLVSQENRRVDFLFCIGWNFLEPVPDRTRALTKDECLPYDREKMKWVPIAAKAVGQKTGNFQYDFPIKRLKTALDSSSIENAVFWLGSIYGREVPDEIYSKLIGMVQDDKIELAPCKIVAAGETLLRGHDGAYDEDTKTIYLSEELFSKNDGYGILTAVVTEEFGHHLEKLIKELYSQDYEAPNDEGACYAWHILTMSLGETGEILVGQVEGGDEITTTVESLQNALETNLTEEEIAWDDKYRSCSFTGGSFTLDDLTEREFNGKNFKMHEAFGAIADGATVTVRSWGRSPDHVSVADAAGHVESVPVEKLDRIPEPKVLTFYKCGLDAQRNSVEKAQKAVDDHIAEEPQYKSNHKTWEDEQNRLEDLLSNRRKEFGRKLAREFMYNRFDTRIKHWVDYYNTLMKPKASLDANVAKSLAFEEGHIGTVGQFFHTPARFNWGFNGDNPVMSRFNLMQAIDSLFQQQILMIQEMDPVLFSTQKFGTLQITLKELMARKETRNKKIYIVWKELDVKNVMAHPGEVEVVLNAMEGFAIKTATATKQPVPDGVQMGVYTDYDFWIRCGVFWMIYKYQIMAKSASWKDGVKRYNGNGPAAEHYRDRVFQRITDAVSGELNVGDA